MKHYRVVLQNPPANGAGRPKGQGPIQKYLNTLLTKHPDQWALFEKNRKNISYLFALKKKTPGMSLRTVSTGNNSYDVYIKMTPVAENN